MVINASKTEAAYFALQELANPPEVNIDGNQIKLKKSINILGLTFDHALQWGSQVESFVSGACSTIQQTSTVWRQEKQSILLQGAVLSQNGGTKLQILHCTLWSVLLLKVCINLLTYIVCSLEKANIYQVSGVI